MADRELAERGVTAADHARAIQRALSQRRWNIALKRADRAWRPMAQQESGFDLDCLDWESPYPEKAQLTPQHFEHHLFAYGAPYLRRAAAELEPFLSGIEARGVEDAREALAQILHSIRERLFQFFRQAAVLELNIARVTGLLSGDTPQARAECFTQLLLGREFRAQCRERYPYLDETLGFITRDTIASICEFFSRLADDREALTELLPAGLGKCESFQFCAGDPHNHGRSVTIVHSSNGSVVYKPRRLDTDLALEKTIHWLESKIAIGLPVLKTIYKEEYGWCEFAASSDCADVPAAARCYEKCGALIGAIFMLCGSDLHYENIICSGENPFITDSEALLTGPLNSPKRFVRELYRTLFETPIHTGYFPSVMMMDQSPVDVSGVGYAGGQAMNIFAIKPDITDDMAFESLAYATPESKNRPTIAGVAQDPQMFLEDIIRGFEKALGAFQTHRAEFLGRADLFPSFASMRSRHVPRATSNYMLIARSGFHPHCCIDRGKQNQAFSALSHEMSGFEESCRGMLASDINALRRGDVPLYKGRADSTSIWTPEGHELRNVFAQSGYEAAFERITSLNPARRSQYINDIKLAFGASAFNRTLHGGKGSDSATTVHGRDQTNVAIAIGENILSMALPSDGALNWVGRGQVGDHMIAKVIDVDLYGGDAGIGIFFAELTRISGDTRFRRAALACLKKIREPNSAAYSNFGAFDGLAGSIYAQLIISRALKLPLPRGLNGAIQSLSQRIDADDKLDIVSGSAGVLLVMLRARSSPELKEAAEALAAQCVARLSHSARHIDGSAAWKIPGFDTCLTGMAHGACGIGMALAEYGAAMGDDASWDLARKAFAYAASSFDSDHGYWKDLRNENSGPMNAWCHGAAGMVLARQHVISIADGRDTRDLQRDVDRGLVALQAYPQVGNDTLCHGRAGNWEPLWRAGRAERASAAYEATLLCDKWKSNVSLRSDFGHPTPDLMNGLAGVGMQLLRSQHTDVACVATLSLGGY